MCTHLVLSPVPPIQGDTPLRIACGGGDNVAIVELLLKAGATVDKAGYQVRGWKQTASIVRSCWYCIFVIFMFVMSDNS